MAKTVKAAPDKPVERPAWKIPPEAVARARVSPQGERRPIFGTAEHPPGVAPVAALAMDADTLAKRSQWAQGAMDQMWDGGFGGGVAYAAAAIASMWQEGVTFLGYAYLAELAQRPEYRVISETIATEATRKWIRFTAKGEDDKADQIDQLTEEFKRLQVQDRFSTISEQDGFFGRSHLYLDTGATEDRAELMQPLGDGWNKISQTKLGKGGLRRLQPVEAVWCYPTEYNSNDPLRPDWYKPSAWFVQGKQMHATRLLTFIGRDVPDLLKPAYSFGGLSMSQMCKPYVDNWLRTRQSVADLIASFSMSGLKCDMQTLLQGDGAEFFKRLALFSATRSNRSIMALNQDTEEFFNVSVPLGTLDALQAQTQEHMAAVSHIPIVKLLGIQPAGLNASSEGEIRSFYDWIGAYQHKMFNEHLRTVLGFAMLSLWGKVDPDIGFEWESLWSMDEKAEAEIRKIDADTDAVLIGQGVLAPEESRARVAKDPDTKYQGLDIDDMPEPPAQQMMGGEEDDTGGEGGGGTGEERQDFREAAE